MMSEPDTRISIRDVISENFYPVHRAIQGRADDGKAYDDFWELGGRGSTKSSFIAIEIILGMKADPLSHTLALRKVRETLRSSVLENLQWAIDVLGMSGEWESTIAPAGIIYRPTGQRIFLRGLDDPKKMKGIKIRFGRIKYLWFEEFDQFDGMTEVRSVKQSVQRGGEGFVTFYSYNPPRDPKHWVNKEAEKEVPKRMLHRSTYLQVRPDWLGTKFLEEARLLQETDPILYQHEYLGEAVGNTKEIIFSGLYRVEDFEIDPTWAGPYDGADWGFAQDPLVRIRCYIDDSFKHSKKKRLYISHEAFGVGVEINEIPQFFDSFPDSRKVIIYADSSQPATISHVKASGFPLIAPAEKWPGSVEDGITILKGYEIIIHTRCTNMQYEAANYRYKVDRLTGDVLTIIVDEDNHGWDGVRYALWKIIKRKPKGFFDL